MLSKEVSSSIFLVFGIIIIIIIRPGIEHRSTRPLSNILPIRPIIVIVIIVIMIKLISQVNLGILVEGDPKAPFYIDTTPGCSGVCFSIQFF